MNSELRKACENLDLLICRKAKIDFMHAMQVKWLVINEYPEDIAELVVAWANDRPLPHVEYNEISYERIVNGTGADFLAAVNLLYILSRDPAGGYMIFTSSLRRDLGRR